MPDAKGHYHVQAVTGNLCQPHRHPHVSRIVDGKTVYHTHDGKRGYARTLAQALRMQAEYRAQVKAHYREQGERVARRNRGER